MLETESSGENKLDLAVGLLSRRRWYIVAMPVATLLATVAALYQLPNRYTSEATLFVVQQQVPLRYVTPTSSTDLADALPAMTQEVLSRNRLLDLVEEFDIYGSKRHRIAPEELVSLMRKDIGIEPLPPAPGRSQSNAFRISFTTSTSSLAHRVTTRLTSLFIQENLKARETQARTTTGFLREHLESAKEKLAAQEGVLRDFKTKYLGELPEQQQGNLAILNGSQLQLQNISSSLDRAQQQRAYLESLVSQYRRVASRGNAVPGGNVGPEAPRPASPYQAARAELARLQAERAKLLINFRSEYPDIVALDRAIARTQRLLNSLQPQSADTGESAQPKGNPVTQPQTVPATEAEEDSAIAQLRSQLESNRIEIVNLIKAEDNQKAVIAEYQSRLNLTPVREQELAGILRDYELSKQDYADLLGKEQQAQLAMSLEQQQGGQQFRLVDPPSLPALPSSPKRLKISFGAMGIGLALGLVAALLVELRAPVFYKEKQVSQRFAVPLVVALPLLLTEKDERRRRWNAAFEWLSGTVLATALLAVEAWVYKHP
jgi:succinoglycan biosynthesis transport protein ExoP